MKERVVFRELEEVLKNKGEGNWNVARGKKGESRFVVLSLRDGP